MHRRNQESAFHFLHSCWKGQEPTHRVKSREVIHSGRLLPWQHILEVHDSDKNFSLLQCRNNERESAL